MHATAPWLTSNPRVETIAEPARQLEPITMLLIGDSIDRFCLLDLFDKVTGAKGTAEHIIDDYQRRQYLRLENMELVRFLFHFGLFGDFISLLDTINFLNMTKPLRISKTEYKLYSVKQKCKNYLTRNINKNSSNNASNGLHLCILHNLWVTPKPFKESTANVLQASQERKWSNHTVLFWNLSVRLPQYIEDPHNFSLRYITLESE